MVIGVHHSGVAVRPQPWSMWQRMWTRRMQKNQKTEWSIGVAWAITWHNPAISGTCRPEYGSPSAGLKFADVPNGLAALSRVCGLGPDPRVHGLLRGLPGPVRGHSGLEGRLWHLIRPFRAIAGLGAARNGQFRATSKTAIARNGFISGRA